MKPIAFAWLVAASAIALVCAVATQEQTPAPATQQDQVYEVGNGVSPPQVIKQVDPQYTPAARAAKITGEVHLKVVVEADGSVDRITVTRSLDKKYGLDDEAIKAAKQWRFGPAKKDGKPVAVWVSLQLEFRL
jgi:protein TonB